MEFWHLYLTQFELQHEKHEYRPPWLVYYKQRLQLHLQFYAQHRVIFANHRRRSEQRHQITRLGL